MNYHIVVVGEDICHHGIKGQKWGVRRYQNEDGSLTSAGIKRYANKNLSEAKTLNLEKWGKNPDTNVLYIAGSPKSGKTTTALGLKSDGDQVIHLDAYLYSNYYKPNTVQEASSLRNKKFESFLDKNFPEWKQIENSTMSANEGHIKRFSNDYYELVNRFRDSVEAFGREEFKDKHKVVVEGRHITDFEFAPGHQFYVDKPVVVLKTSSDKTGANRFTNNFAIDIDARKTVNQVLSKSQSKALNKVVRDQRVKKGEAVAGFILGGSLAGLTWSYLKDLGLI